MRQPNKPRWGLARVAVALLCTAATAEKSASFTEYAVPPQIVPETTVVVVEGHTDPEGYELYIDALVDKGHPVVTASFGPSSAFHLVDRLDSLWTYLTSTQSPTTHSAGVNLDTYVIVGYSSGAWVGYNACMRDQARCVRFVSLDGVFCPPIVPRIFAPSTFPNRTVGSFRSTVPSCFIGGGDSKLCVPPCCTTVQSFNRHSAQSADNHTQLILMPSMRHADFQLLSRRTRFQRGLVCAHFGRPRSSTALEVDQARVVSHVLSCVTRNPNDRIPLR